MEKEDEVLLIDDEDDDVNLQTTKNTTETAEKNFNEPASLELSTDSKERVPDDQPKSEETAQITIRNTKDRGNDLDKFKRRLIRAIAHLILKDNCLSNEIWDELKKQTGCNCKLLWDRMRALTIKKLRRLFTAEDVVGNITNIARLSVTDWLLFDLVLVHENIDCIGQDITSELKEHPKILKDLFWLVIQFNIEHLQGDALTKAWFEATKKYNGSTRQCSPMLLQRRWYQLKETIRDKFYQFWFNYRGDQRKLAIANQFRPNDLDMEIVKQYQYIATKPFPTWEELITAKRVSLPDDFERLQLAKIKKFRNENEPDLEVIEPEVETIDLELDSDSEVSRDSSSVREMSDDGNKKDTTILSKQNTATSDSPIDIGIVKMETIAEISDEDIHILESTHTKTESEKNFDICDEEDNRNEECEIPTPNENHNDIMMFKANEDLLNKEFPNGSTSIETENVISKVEDDDDLKLKNITGEIFKEEIEMKMPTIVASMSIENIKGDLESIMPKITNVSSTAVSADEPYAINNEVECILESVAEKIAINKSYNTLKSDRMLPLQEDIKNHDVSVKKIKDEKVYAKETEVKKLESLNTVLDDMNIFDGIELEDDGIAYVEEDDLPKEELNTEIKVEDYESNDNTPTIDLKLLLTPVVYTKKIDDMDVFRFIDYDMVKDKRVIENADHESKPVDKNSVKMEEISQQRTPTPDNDTVSESGSENNSEVDDGPEVVSCSSWLLNKPRILSYNPILLCKNPDFNTRLKRLSAGFFISARNRDLLKECKPLTIDLHKAFEHKLTNNTLYLKDTQFLQKIKVGGENVEENNTSPSTKEIINITELTPDFVNQSSTFSVTDSRPVERNKVINLPDIDQVRRLNERLLVAEVTPIQVTNTVKAPVNIVHPKLETTIQNKHTTAVNIKTDETIMISTNNEEPDPGKSQERGISENCIISNVKSSKMINVNRIASAIQKGNIHNEHQQKKRQKSIARVNHVKVPWNHPVPSQDIPKDRLLAPDTVQKILSVCGGHVDKWPRYKSFKKAMKRKASNDIGISKGVFETKRKFIDHNLLNELVTDNKLPFVGENVTIESKPRQVNSRKKVVVNQKKKSNSKSIKTRKNINKNEEKEFCCWARERMLYLKTKRKCKPHRCPQPLCQCCCRQELVKMMLKKGKQDKKPVGNSDLELEVQVVQPVQEIIPSQNNNEQVTKSQVISSVQSEQELILNQMTIKVSIGINTDYDKDFENSFAARLSELNSTQTNSNQESLPTDSLHEAYASFKRNVSHQTQTSVNLTDTQRGSIVSNSESSVSTADLTKDKNNKYSTIKPKCKVHSAESDVYFRKIAPKGGFLQTCRNSTLISDSGKVLLQERSEKPDKVLFLTNEKNKHNYSQSPICLGKNKILLCSFKKPSVNLIEVNQIDYNNCSENTQPQVSLPDGVRIVLLPNKELALSIDPGIELDPSELANLPVLMQSIQQQLRDSDFFNEYENDLNNQTINTIKQCNETEINLEHNNEKGNENAVSISSVPEDHLTQTENILNENASSISSVPAYHLSQTKDILNENAESISSVPEDHLTQTKNILNENAASISSVPEKNLSQTKDILNENAESISSVPKDYLTEAKDVLNENAESISSVPEDHLTETKDILDTNKAHVPGNDSTNADVNDFDDTSTLHKKTILSDLMEMSGISAEDISLKNIGSPTKQQPELIHHSTSTLEELQTQPAHPPNENTLNNPLYKNHMVQAALSRCPELSIVYSYQELKYASENNAQFFKMDIETGVIIPINLCIKKQIQSLKSKPRFTCSKSIIDLTDEPDNDDDVHEAPMKIKDISKPQASSILKILEEKRKEMAVPVKLFSSVRPLILRNRKSLLLDSVKSDHKTAPKTKCKKRIRIIKIRKRKLPTDSITSIELDSDTEIKDDNAETYSSAMTMEKRKTDDESDSDDEPLALIAKRKKESSNVSINQSIANNDKSQKVNEENEHTEMVNEETNQDSMNSTNNKEPECISEEVYIESIPQADPVLLEPLRFEVNNPESSEEDCILGV